MKNKNILMIAYYFPPAAGIGTFRITKFCKYLKKLGYNPIILAPKREYYTNTDNTLLADLDGIQRYEIELDNNRSAKDFYVAIKKEIDTIYKKANFQYAFITGGPFAYMKIGTFLYKKYGIKYIADFRDPWSLQKTIDGSFLRRLKNIIYKRYARLIERQIFKYSLYVTMVNDTMTNEYQSVFPKYKDKIVTLPNAIDIDDYRNIKPHKFDCKTILYTGKFGTSSGFRNPTNFLLALKEFNKNSKSLIKFVHVGYKEDRVVNIVKELGCEELVEFCGSKSYQDTISYCKGADILLLIGTGEKSEQTGKIYDYIGCERKILAIINSNNEIFKICNKYDIKTANPSDYNEIEKVILSLFEVEEPHYDINEMQTRETVTKDLIDLLEKN